jgi:hypothetical protein
LAGVPQCTAAKAIDRVRDSGLVCEMYNAVQNWVQRKACNPRKRFESGCTVLLFDGRIIAVRSVVAARLFDRGVK